MAHGGRMSAIWLRTCYAPELAANYTALGLLDDFVNPRNVLDDEALYGSFAGDWRQIFIRVPSIPDVQQILGDPDLEADPIPDENWGEPDEEYQRPAHEAQKREKTIMYLLDEEALRERVTKVMWLDAHGNCVWDFKIRDIWEFQGPLLRGLFITEIITNCAYNDDHTMWERGALLLHTFG